MKKQSTSTSTSKNKSTTTSTKNDNSKKATSQSEKNNNTENQPSLLEKFFIDQLKDIYWAENHLLKALEKMKEAATSEELKEAFEDHKHVTQKQASRLERIFKLLDKKPEGKKCEAMEGLTKEADQIIKETKEGTMTRDAALIIAAQKVEHYEIATYGGLVQLALTMDLNEIADILDKSLMEEEDTDQLLTSIAEDDINVQAELEPANSNKKQEKEEFETA